MATSVTVSPVLPSNYVTATSRYSDSDVLIYGEDGILTFETYKRTDIPTAESDLRTTIPIGEEYRPDLTSFQAYGTVDFWWKLMQANDIADIYDYKAGLTIRIPSPFDF